MVVLRNDKLGTIIEANVVLTIVLRFTSVIILRGRSAIGTLNVFILGRVGKDAEVRGVRG